MKCVFAFCGLAVMLASVSAVKSSPKVQVFSSAPGVYGVSNKLVCHVSGFHPPDITIELLRNGVVIPGAQQTDLAFEQSWQFHLSRSVDFTPQKDEEYACRVTYQGKAQTHTWDAKV